MTRRGFNTAFTRIGLMLVLAVSTLATAQDADSGTERVAGTPQDDLAALLRGLRAVREVFTQEERRRDDLIHGIAARIRADKTLQGGYYDFEAKKRVLNASELERGKSQLRRMLKDRPMMAEGLTEEDELFQWAARKFAGEDVPTWIEWQNTSPPHVADFEAWHRPPGDNRPGYLSVGETHGPHSQKNGEALAFDELWLRAAYELHNIQSHREFRDLWEKAFSGAIRRDDYILECARLEYDAWLRTRLFYVETYYPWAKKRGLKASPKWGLTLPDTFEGLIACYPRDTRYPWGYFGDAYDEATVSRELRASSVDWRKLKKRGGQAWQQLKTEVMLRQRARLLWNKIATAGPLVR